MAHRSLRLAAASYVLGLANTDEQINAADQALNDSVYSYSLGELATHHDPNWGDCSRLFVTALEELELKLPDPSEAVMTLLEHHVVRLAEGAASPTEVLHRLYTMQLELGYGSPAKVPQSALEPLRPFIDLYYAIDQYISYQAYTEEQGIAQPDDGGVGKIYDDALALATRWCRERWGHTIQVSWCTDTVLSLARQMYESREFSAMPILADALQDAGCDNDDILSHCRGAGPHVRGCWVVDLVLGKE